MMMDRIFCPPVSCPEGPSAQQLVPVVPPPWLVSRGCDETLDLLGIQAEAGACLRNHVLLHHHAPKIVGAVLECDLSDLRTLCYPGALHVFKVIQEDARERLHSQVFGGSDRLCAELGVLRLEGPADERGEPTRLILKIAQALQVLDAIL